MYRALPLLLILGAATAAPQSTIADASVDEDLHPGSDQLDPSIPGVLPLADNGDDDDDDEVASTTVAEDLTETTEVTTTEVTTTQRPRKRYRSRAKSPINFSKLSYFQKSDLPAVSRVNQLDGTSEKRRFISKCRCEKIWNCPKLQITVPRCPNEYFLCCF